MALIGETTVAESNIPSNSSAPSGAPSGAQPRTPSPGVGTGKNNDYSSPSRLSRSPNAGP